MLRIEKVNIRQITHLLMVILLRHPLPPSQWVLCTLVRALLQATHGLSPANG